MTNGGGESCSAEFNNFHLYKGITHHTTAPNTPQKNSMAKRGNQKKIEKARSLLKHASLPNSMWGEGVMTAVFYKNITPMEFLKWITPHKFWFGTPFNLLWLRTFGCLAYVKIPKEHQSKFGNTAKKGILVGYLEGIHNWRILYLGNWVEYSHDFVFNKAEFSGISSDSPANTL